MNDTQKDIKKTEINREDLEKKLEELNRILLGLNAFGSLELTDLHLISNYIRGAFNYKFLDDYLLDDKE
ncbi:hypothetical protein FJR48_09025 [Sulfurimonas lithotrophica]|uniref:Uncharacterized protein n=1 Tax=Sulfurimonas lithotrophica TaxID=2590022 RepID=A0A5P8P2B5_9BACT|nr:hypothetical protein [Sulfurimonas lithotrophica]QFR49862.1 hypothetical protein FJR48_09025 [Sulfurimonas lithotrophica]